MQNSNYRIEEQELDHYIISTDIGSQSIKTALYDEHGKLINLFTQEMKLHKAAVGALIYYGDEVYEQTLTNIEHVIKDSNIDPTNVAILAFTGMGGGIICIDKYWVPISEYTNPLDNRDHPYFIDMMKQYGYLIRSVSGTGSPMGANKILWFKHEFPEIYQKTKKFMLLTQYVQGKMSGLKASEAIWEFTSASLSGLCESQRFAWSEEVCDKLGIDGEKLPKIVNTTDIIGTLTREASIKCGLKEGVPIVAGAFDKPCDQLGSGSNKIGYIVDNAATYPALTVCVDRYIPDEVFKTLDCIPSATQGLWIAMTYITGGGLTHKWFCENFCCEELQSANALECDAFSILDQKAAKLPPGSEGLYFIPHLSGRATPSMPDVKGLWVGFSWTHNREHFYRSILESIAYDHACSLRVVRDLYSHIRLNQVRVLGGGASSSFWNQIKANVLGLPYVKLNRNDTTVLGAAILGGASIGLFNDINETSVKFSEITEVFKPQEDLHNKYQESIDIYDLIFKELKTVYNRIAQITQD